MRTESGASLAKFKLADKQRVLVELLKYCQAVDEAKASESAKATNPPGRPSASNIAPIFPIEEMRAKYNVRVGAK